MSASPDQHLSGARPCRRAIRALAACRSGGAALEYALIAGVLSLAVVGAGTKAGAQAQKVFSYLTAQMGGVGDGPPALGLKDK